MGRVTAPGLRRSELAQQLPNDPLALFLTLGFARRKRRRHRRRSGRVRTLASILVGWCRRCCGRGMRLPKLRCGAGVFFCL